MLSSHFAGGLHPLSYSEIKQQGEMAAAPPASPMPLQNSGAVLWLLFAGGGGDELTEPWPHLSPPPPVLHPQELGLPVVWQELCKHVPQTASPRLPLLHALAREETPQPGMWKGISTGFNEVGLPHPSAGPEDAGIPPAGVGQHWERSCPTWCRAGTELKQYQGWFPAWGHSTGSIPALQPGGHSPRTLLPLLLQGSGRARAARGGKVV